METVDRVREHSSGEGNRKVDIETRQRLREAARAGRDEMTARMDELDREWDVERLLQTNASILALSGIVLGATVSKKFLFLPATVMTFLLQHSLQGWCPPLPVFRKMGVRTRKEINREKYALKALRGDFADIGAGEPRS